MDAIELDFQVKRYLQEHKNLWKRWNISYEDGQALYDLLITKKYSSGLEIGTAAGHSAIWIAWALSKNQGKLITLEIDRKRNAQAIKNFIAAGVDSFIEAKVADANLIIPSLDLEFDFVFSDATISFQTKDAYINFFKLVEASIKPGGCFAMHNVLDSYGDDGRCLDYIKSLPNYTTEILKTSAAGISISFKQ